MSHSPEECQPVRAAAAASALVGTANLAAHCDNHCADHLANTPTDVTAGDPSELCYHVSWCGVFSGVWTVPVLQ